MEVLRRIISNTINSRQLLKNIYSGSQKPHVEKLDDTGIQSPDERLMERVMKTLNKHLSDSDITIEEIAEEIGISRAHLHRKLKELTNQSPRNFIRNVRLQHAASLLSEKKHSISEVAYITGFSSPAQFATAFKIYTARLRPNIETKTAKNTCSRCFTHAHQHIIHRDLARMQH